MTIRIGVLLGELQERADGAWYDIWQNCLALCIDEANDAGLLPQPVELLWEHVNGLPWGSAHAVVEGWRRLCDAGALAIVGPSNADNCRSVLASANELETPTIVFGCSHELASEWTFSVSWGSAPVDATLAVNWIAAQGLRRAAILADRAWHATEWIEHLGVAARRYGVQIVGTERIELFSGGLEPQLVDARRCVRRLAGLDADVLVMACSVAAGVAALAVDEAGWATPRIKAGAAFGGAPEWEGWVGTALYDEANPTYQVWRTEYERRFGQAPVGSLLDLALSFTDGIRALLHGITLAPIHNREGVKAGLERVKLLPAVAGGPTTVVSFGPHDHRAHKGRDTSVLQRYVGPGPGSFEFEAYFDVAT